MVEVALVLPVFLLAMAGIVEFGRAMMVSQLVTNAAREGSRKSVIDGSTNAAVESYIKDRLADSLKVKAADISVGITITPDPNNNTTGNNLADAQPYDLVTVNVSVPFEKVGFVAAKWLQNANISAETTMRHE